MQSSGLTIENTASVGKVCNSPTDRTDPIDHHKVYEAARESKREANNGYSTRAGLAVKSYGAVTYNDASDEWIITAEPHVSIRLKDVFRQIAKHRVGAHQISNTVQNAKDIEWFISRYPMEISDRDAGILSAAAFKYDCQQAALERILLPDYKPKKIKLAKELRNYQLVMVDLWRNGKDLLCADDLGLGKTVEAIGCFASEPGSLPVAIVCPTHMPFHWKRKIEEFAPNLTIHTIKKTMAYSLPSADVYIFTYSKLRGWSDIFNEGYFRSVVYDEVQELRIPDSAKYCAAKVLSQNSEYHLALSATPIQNYAGEIHAVMELLRPGALGSIAEFKREWCSGDYRDKGIVSDPKALGSYLLEQHLMIRRTRQDVGKELPPVNKIIQYVPYNEKHVDDMEDTLRMIAQTVLSGDFHSSGEAARELDIMARMMTGVAKAAGVAEFVRMLLQTGEKVLLAGWHREVYEIWNKLLSKDFRVVMYTGSESGSKKDKNAQAFINDEADLMMISLRSGAGLDGLQTACTTAVFGELDWSPGVHDQLVGRLQRDGQAGPVTAYYLVTDSGSDPLMIDVLGLKASQSDGVMNPDGKDILSTVSDTGRIKRLAQQVVQHGIRGIGAT